MGARAVRAAAAAALVPAGLAGCTTATSGKVSGPPDITRDEGGPASGTSQSPPVTVYVIAGGAVVAIRAATGTPRRMTMAGTDAIAITPDGKTAYVTNYNHGTVIPISSATNTAGPPIRTGTNPSDIAIIPDGKTAYVSNKGSGTVTPIDTATNTPGTPIPTGSSSGPIAIAP